MNAIWIAVIVLLAGGWFALRRGHGLLGGLAIIAGVVSVAGTPGPLGDFVTALCKGVPVGLGAYFHYVGSAL